MTDATDGHKPNALPLVHARGVIIVHPIFMMLKVLPLFCRLKKVSAEEKKPEKADPMVDMMERIRTGNVQLKRVQGDPVAKQPKSGSGDVMSEMAKLLVSLCLTIQCKCVVCILGENTVRRLLCVCTKDAQYKEDEFLLMFTFCMLRSTMP